MAIPTIGYATAATNYDYGFVPTTGVTFPAGTCRALWVSHNASATITVIIDNGDSVVVGVNGSGLLPLRVKQISANASSVNVVALY